MSIEPADNELQCLSMKLCSQLVDEVGTGGFWQGRLSSSALATTLAVYALHLYDEQKHASLISGGLSWLAENQNCDGGWGDTARSKSNISTTLLCMATIKKVAGQNPGSLDTAFQKANQWLDRRIKNTSPSGIIEAVKKKYKDDLTFSCPILSVCALSGLLGDRKAAFEQIPALPFELAALPHGFFRFINTPVVSYASPALIALGQLHYHHVKPVNPVLKAIRAASIAKTLKKLGAIQPQSGGFLEAAPLTSFVAISLCSINRQRHPVTEKCIQFLTTTVRADSRWAIDTNLSNWLTSLSINALASGSSLAQTLSDSHRNKLYRHLLEQQFKEVHPYTGAKPGGWAWTNLPGGVPDADDTSAALTALINLWKKQENSEKENRSEFTNCLSSGVNWLINLQNADGGVPTFCRGRTNLDFDTSAPDITAHAICAASRCKEFLNGRDKRRADAFISKALKYLKNCRDENGLWTPLWFGNEYLPRQVNPVFGTSRIITYLCDARENLPLTAGLMQAAVEEILARQNSDGGWGQADPSESSIEETAAAVDAIASYALKFKSLNPDMKKSLDNGVKYLMKNLYEKKLDELQPAPIGLYFAKLWYYERLYPLIFSVSALSKASAISA